MKTTEVFLGGQKITIQKIKPLELPAPSIPPTPESLDPDVEDPLVEVPEEQVNMVYSHVIATVYDGGKTFVRWQPEGGGQTSLAGWSNVDFNHFSGFTWFQHGGKEYVLLMMVSNVDTAETTQAMTVPELPEDHPAFVITEGNAGAPGALAIMEGLHAFYQAEGPGLQRAHEEREQAREEQAAILEAGPPVKKDIVLRYWRTGGKSLNPQARVKP